MKYMLIMRSTAAAREASKHLDVEEVLNRMGAYNEALVTAGVLLSGEGLADVNTAGNAFVVDFDEDPPRITDGPYGQAHELFNGFWVLEVSSVAEAVEWASRCPWTPGPSWKSAGFPGWRISRTSQTTSSSARKSAGGRSRRRTGISSRAGVVPID